MLQVFTLAAAISLSASAVSAYAVPMELPSLTFPKDDIVITENCTHVVGEDPPVCDTSQG